MRDLFGFERQPQPASVNTPAFAPDKKEFEIQGVKSGMWTWCDSPVAK